MPGPLGSPRWLEVHPAVGGRGSSERLRGVRREGFLGGPPGVVNAFSSGGGRSPVEWILLRNLKWSTAWSLSRLLVRLPSGLLRCR